MACSTGVSQRLCVAAAGRADRSQAGRLPVCGMCIAFRLSLPCCNSLRNYYMDVLSLASTQRMRQLCSSSR